jgi:hypothetical protein
VYVGLYLWPNFTPNYKNDSILLMAIRPVVKEKVSHSHNIVIYHNINTVHCKQVAYFLSIYDLSFTLRLTKVALQHHKFASLSVMLSLLIPGSNYVGVASNGITYVPTLWKSVNWLNNWKAEFTDILYDAFLTLLSLRRGSMLKKSELDIKEDNHPTMNFRDENTSNDVWL